MDMSPHPDLQTPRVTRRAPDPWIAAVFSSKAAARGGMVRRSVVWVDREVGRKRFMAEVRPRGFHMVEDGGQFVVFCNQAKVRLVC
jgi:hypothetical protein